MRELLITITLLSLVSSEEYEPRKRFGIPPEEDPNFWPTRGRRSYWSSPRLIGNLIRRDLPQGPDVDYSSHLRSWPIENDFSRTPGVLGYSDSWRVHVCPQKKPISLILPLEEYLPDEAELSGCGGRCSGPIRGRGRRGDERWRRQQPLYAEEPGWIPIDFERGVLGRSMGDEDPFIVARGKKRTDKSSEVRERRQLEDVIGSYDTDPFFVARGKRNVESGGTGSKGVSEDRSFEENSANESRRPRRSESEGKKEKRANSEGVQKVSSNENHGKFSSVLSKRKRSEDRDDKGPFLTNPGIEEGHEEIRHRRLERSSTSSSSSSTSSSSSSSGIFQGDENKWIRTDPGHTSGVETHDFSAKPRYSRPRDKHSNLQSILDEPFFVSRGKKNRVEPGLRVGEYLRYDGDDVAEELPIKIVAEAEREIFKNLYPGARISTPKDGGVHYNDDDIELLAKVFAEGLRPFKDQNNPPRTRRGMLDDLLKGDDPFYVARGKRIYPQTDREGYFDLMINRANDPDPNSNGRFSLFAKSTRTRLLQKLLDYSKIRSYPYEGRTRSWNVTHDLIN